MITEKPGQHRYWKQQCIEARLERDNAYVELAKLKEIAQEEVTNAIHPEFGWIWQPDEIGGKLGKKAEDAEQKVAELETENNKLRGILADGNDPCIYCGLSKADMSKCASGFPGCARADDLIMKEAAE